MRNLRHLALAVALFASVGTFAFTAAFEGLEWGAAATALLVATSLAGREENAAQSYGVVTATAVIFLAVWQAASLELGLFLLIGASVAAILWRLGRLLRPLPHQREEQYSKSATYAERQEFSSKAVGESPGPAYDSDPLPTQPEPSVAEPSSQPFQGASEEIEPTSQIDELDHPDIDSQPEQPQDQQSEPLALREQEAQTAAKVAWEVLIVLREIRFDAKGFDVWAAAARRPNLVELSRECQRIQREDRQTEWAYRVGWSVSCLRMLGAVERNSHTTTGYGRTVNRSEVLIRSQDYFAPKLQVDEYRPKRLSVQNPNAPTHGGANRNWREELMVRLLGLQPACFEHFCAEFLRAAGYEVEIRGGMGDGGIDGVAWLDDDPDKVRVYFQAKRWKGHVGPSEVRDFRGALDGRSNRGLLITSGFFSPDAKKEAQREGATEITLIDGHRLAEQAQKFRVGLVLDGDAVKIDEAWFTDLERRC